MSSLKERVISDRYSDFGREHRYSEYNPTDRDDLDDALVKFIFAEKDAVEAAQRGDLAALIKILRGPHRDWLQPETVELMIEFMTGKRNPQTGRRRGEGKVGARVRTH
jgi:hypothetical protein